MSPNELKLKEFSLSIAKKYHPVNNIQTFNGDICYKWDDGMSKIDLFDIDIFINLNSNSFGNIDLSDGNEILKKGLISEIVINFANTHVDVNSNNTLIITGKSDEIGDFKILIYPNFN